MFNHDLKINNQQEETMKSIRTAIMLSGITIAMVIPILSIEYLDDAAAARDFAEANQLWQTIRETMQKAKSDDVALKEAIRLFFDTSLYHDECIESARTMADEMGMQSFLLPEYELPSFSAETAAITGSDPMTALHMKNWMECVRSRKQPNAPVDAGYNHSVANIMTTAALRTGEKATFDEAAQEVLAGGKVFKY